jgi:hypothetical protein
MGSSYTNLQVRSRDYERVVRSLEEASVLPVFLSQPCDRGWISVYPRVTESQDPDKLRSIAELLSRELETGVFGLLVHDSDLFWYILYENGRLTDEYESDPGYFDGEDDSPPSGGNMQAVVRYCLPGTTIKELAETFSKKPNRVVGAVKFFWHLARKDFDKAFNSTSIFRGDSLAANFAEKLGLNRERVSVGYKYIKQGDERTGLTLLKNEEEESVRKQGKVGPPQLLTEEQHRIKQITDPAAKYRYEQYLANVPAERVPLGVESTWYGTVKNEGGYSSGVRFTLEGDALAQGMFESVRGSLEKWQSRSDEESDYEEPDLYDESFWPYTFLFTRSQCEDVWVAEISEFAYTREFLVRLPLVPVKNGAARLKATITPLAENGTSTVSFNLAIDAIAPERDPDSAPKPFKTHNLNVCKITLPGHLTVTSQEGKGLMTAMGIKFQLRASGNFNTQFDVSIQAPPKTVAESPSLSALLDSQRTRLRAREFVHEEIETIGGSDCNIRIARWKSSKACGFVGMGTSGGDDVVVRAETNNSALLKELIDAVATLKVS